MTYKELKSLRHIDVIIAYAEKLLNIVQSSKIKKAFRRQTQILSLEMLNVFLHLIRLRRIAFPVCVQGTDRLELEQN